MTRLNQTNQINQMDQGATTGEIYKMELDGTVIGKFGRPGHAFGEFSSVHQMDCRNANEMYVSEFTAWRVQKIMLRPAAPGRTASGR